MLFLICYLAFWLRGGDRMQGLLVVRVGACDIVAELTYHLTHHLAHVLVVLHAIASVG